MVEVYSIKNWFKCFTLFIFVSFMVASAFPNTKIVKVVSGDFYPPFIWVDDEGNPQGFSVDFFKLLKEKTKLNFELKPMRFSDALQQIKTGKADMINFIFKTPEREKYMLFSNPILEVKSNVYYRKELNLKNLSDLGPYVIAAIKGDANVSLVLKNYPQLNFKFYDNFSNLMEAVKNRKVNVFIMEDFTAHYYLVKADLTTAFHKLNISKQNLYLGISKDRTDLLKIINDAINSSRDEINSFAELYYSKESFFKVPKWFVIMIIAILAIAVIIFYVVLIVNRYLKNEVKKRTRDLQLKNEELQAAHEEISAINQELTASNEELEGAYREVSNYQNQLDQILDLISKIVERDVNEETYFKESSKFLFEHIPAFEFTILINFINDEKRESLDATILSKDNDFKKFTLRKTPQRMREYLINDDNKILRIEDFIHKYPFEELENYINQNKFNSSDVLIYSIRKGKRVTSFLTFGIKDMKYYQNNRSKIEKILKMLSIFFILNEYSKEKSIFHKKLILTVTKALEYYDPYTKGHSENVADYAAKIAEKLGLDHEKISKIYWAGLLHDVGRIFIPQSVLNKVGKLTAEEYKLIKIHPIKSYELIKEVEGLEDIAEIVLYHHERYDGKGYPYGKKGEEIPLESRILTVADSFDAMRSDRPYKKAFSLRKIIEELKENSGTQFDPKIAEILIEIILSEFNYKIAD